MSNVVALMQSHDDTLVSGLIAHCGDAPYRHQDIRLRIVGCRTPQGNRVRNDDEVLRFANFVFEMTVDIDQVSSFQSSIFDLGRVQENDTPSSINAAVPIIESVNG